MSFKPVYIGKRRELFWDDTLINRAESTTETVLHHPVQRECVVTCNDPWGGNGACFMSVLDDGSGVYRMYVDVCRRPNYQPGPPLEHNAGCYYESTDGVHWTKPSLGLCDFHGSADNNIFNWGSFRVMRDFNPDCRPDEKYKAVSDKNINGDQYLVLFTSEDGKRFTRRHPLNIRDETTFDSLNTILYNRLTGRYECFMRGFHIMNDPQNRHIIRGILRSESTDLVNWTHPEHLQYEPAADWQLYTNAISHYYRADHVYVGFPVRYVERLSGWTGNYDELCGVEDRRERLGWDQPRHATSITDSLFMTSRDGIHWRRFGESFLTPGPEHPGGWTYGSSYIAPGMLETPSSTPGADNEISLYACEGRFMPEPARIYRYTVRLDGFASQRAPYSGAHLLTRPFIFDGDCLHINFATSAAGHIRILLVRDDGLAADSGELFGDSADRIVRFDRSILPFAGRPVTMQIDMYDADIYSFIFQ